MEKVIYVLHYAQAPMNAQYILRCITGTTWALERYYDADSKVVLTFEISTLPGEEERDFAAAIEACEKKIPKKAILYVEKPSYLVSDDEIDELLAHM